MTPPDPERVREGGGQVCGARGEGTLGDAVLLSTLTSWKRKVFQSVRACSEGALSFSEQLLETRWIQAGGLATPAVTA